MAVHAAETDLYIFTCMRCEKITKKTGSFWASYADCIR